MFKQIPSPLSYSLIIVIAIISAIVLMGSGVLAASISESSTARLTIFDTTDTGNRGVFTPITVFATFSNASTSQPINGSCQLSVAVINLVNQPMTVNGLGDNRYNLSVPQLPEGDHIAAVTCSANGFGSLTATDVISVHPNANLSISSPPIANANEQVVFSVLYSNASSGSPLSLGQCVMHFTGEAGDPLNPALTYNPSHIAYELQRSFPVSGTFRFQANCTAPGFDPAGALGSISIRDYLPRFSNFTDSQTTNFAAISNVDNIQVSLANQFGRIRWIHPVNATLRDFDSNVRLGSNFAAVNVPRLGEGYNSSIEIILFNAASTTVVSSPLFSSSVAEVKTSGNPCTGITQPACTDIIVVGSTVSFKATFPASFGLGSDANLTTSSPGAIAQFTSIPIIGNYSNSSNGAPITNALPFNGACSISFSPEAGDPVNGVMAFYESGTYQFLRQFNKDGTFAYNVTCESDPFAMRQSSGSLIVVPVGAPPSSVQNAGELNGAEQNPTTVQAPQDVPPGPLEIGVESQPLHPPSEPSPSRTLIATSGGLTTSLNVGEEADVLVNQVAVVVGVSYIKGGMAKVRLGNQQGELSQGQELAMDIDRDGKPDVAMRILGLAEDSAKVIITKMRGLDDVGDNSGSDQANSPDSISGNAVSGAGGKKKPVLINEPEPKKKGVSWWWFVVIFVALLGIGRWYFHYNQRMRNRFL